MASEAEVTAIKPLANLRVLASPSERYPGNRVCSMPECTDPTADFHHCFPRSQIAGDSWFVRIADEDTGAYTAEPIPHVTGLCRAHHSDVEEHRAWIKLEEGVFSWWDRNGKCPTTTGCNCQGVCEAPEWILTGHLNPQPGGVEGKPKVKKKSSEEKRKRKTISLRVPADSEDGAVVYDEYLVRVKERLVIMDLYTTDEKIPAYEATIAAWDDWLNS